MAAKSKNRHFLNGIQNIQQIIMKPFVRRLNPTELLFLLEKSIAIMPPLLRLHDIIDIPRDLLLSEFDRNALIELSPLHKSSTSQHLIEYANTRNPSTRLAISDCNGAGDKR